MTILVSFINIVTLDLIEEHEPNLSNFALFLRLYQIWVCLFN